jgi:hypothetical protein
MASSGLLPYQTTDMMNETLTVYAAGGRNRHAEETDSGATREVDSYSVPSKQSVFDGDNQRVRLDVDVYCDDVGILVTEHVSLPGSAIKREIQSVQTFNDENGNAVYQVLGLA